MGLSTSTKIIIGFGVGFFVVCIIVLLCLWDPANVFSTPEVETKTDPPQGGNGGQKQNDLNYPDQGGDKYPNQDNTDTQDTTGDNYNDSSNDKKYNYTPYQGFIGQALPCPNFEVLPGGNNTKYCEVSVSDAPKICQMLDNCGGYAVTTNVAWNAKFPTAAAQLIDKTKPYNLNSEWTFHKQSDASTIGKKYKYTTRPGQIGQGPFACPTFTHPGSEASTQCVVPVDKADKICQLFENCGGYAITPNVNHNRKYPNTAGLYDKNKPLVANAEWTSYEQIFE